MDMGAKAQVVSIEEKKDFRGVEQYWQLVNQIKHDGLYPYFKGVEEVQDAWVVVKGKRMQMYATYNYLGLLGDARIKEAAVFATLKYGTGTHGVRINGGTLDLHQELEKKIARYMNTEAAIVYGSGYMTNVAALSTLVGKGDYIICDKFNHASIVDGCNLSVASVKRFRHNCMEHLEHVLRGLPAQGTKLVVADSVFSMDGDIFNLPKARELCDRYGAMLMIDEAHSIGVLGSNGGGIEEHYAMPGSVDVKMGTLSKAIPSIGGYIAGSNKLINFLKHTSKPFIFSAAMVPGSVAAASKAIDILKEEGHTRRERVISMSDYFATRLQEANFSTGLAMKGVPIIPVIVGDMMAAINLTKHCMDNDIFALPVLSPAVHPTQCRLRINVTAMHKREDVDAALDVIKAGGRKLGIIAG